MRTLDSLRDDRTFKQPVVWVTTLFMVIFHIGAIAALFVFSWPAFLLAMMLWWVAGGLGIGMGTTGFSHIAATRPRSGWNMF